MISQKKILFYNDKGGCGVSTIAYSIVKKIAKPKKTLILSNSKYSEYTKNKCVLKTSYLYVNYEQMKVIIDQLNNNSKKLKHYSYIIFDMSNYQNNDEYENLKDILQFADLIVIPIVIDYFYTLQIENIKKLLEDTNNQCNSKIKFVINHLKPHYNKEIQESVISYLDKFTRDNNISICEYAFSYHKSIENPKRILDNKESKSTLMYFTSLIK